MIEKIKLTGVEETMLQTVYAMLKKVRDVVPLVIRKQKKSLIILIMIFI